LSLPNEQGTTNSSITTSLCFLFCIFFALSFFCLLARLDFPLGIFQPFGFPSFSPFDRLTGFHCIHFIMPVATSHLAIGFAVAGPRGTAFFNSINPPGKADTLHAILLDGTTKVPAMGEIHQSFGHRVSRVTQQDLTVPDVFLSGQKRIDYGTAGFDKLNDPQVSETARLQSLQDYPVGAVLLVSVGGGAVPYITVLANPTITPVDPNSHDSPGGAPVWEEAFESTLLQRFVAAGSIPTHGILSSGSWKTRATTCNTREGLIHISHPIMLT
jgi:hypothetical protein